MPCPAEGNAIALNPSFWPEISAASVMPRVAFWMPVSIEIVLRVCHARQTLAAKANHLTINTTSMEISADKEPAVCVLSA